MLRGFLFAALIAAVSVCFAAPSASADDLTSSRDLQAAVDSYLASANDDAALVGGPGSAGYDAGFWIRGGDFMLRINATIQARFEAWDWDDEDLAEQIYDDSPFGWAGDLSGFSLPRATIKLSGEAPCDICYYIELDFGHFGRDFFDILEADQGGLGDDQLGPFIESQSYNYDNTREAWIEWCSCDAFNFRMGQIKLASTRQLMVAPELQQFVDISLASSWTGYWLPGYTDRNRDHGFMVHGSFGCDNEWSYMVTVTNGDGGDSIRNVLDHRTSDNLAYGARLNWAFLDPIGYEEGALRQQTCGWYGELGAWAFYYADREDKPHETVADFLVFGADLALGYGGFSFTGALTIAEADPDSGDAVESTIWLAQLGYHFPGTAWEIAARASSYNLDAGSIDGTTSEFAFGVNYYLNGHGNKLQLDVSLINVEEDGILWIDPYPGYNLAGFGGGNNGDEQDIIMIRFQWQLAL